MFFLHPMNDDLKFIGRRNINKKLFLNSNVKINA